MGLGILEPKDDVLDVTGTIVMIANRHATEQSTLVTDNHTHQKEDKDKDQNNANNQLSSELHSITTLKTTKRGVILYPQPHDDPNDPLNWPLWRRDLALVAVGWHSFVGGGQTSILAAGLSEMSHEFHKSPSQIAYLVGGFMLAFGVGSLFAAPTAVLYGKRIVYLVGILISFAGALWGANAHSFGSLVGARVLMGLSFSVVESLPSATVAEIYFAHERAYRLGLYTMLLLGGKNLIPLLAAFVFQDLDRSWLFYIVAIICAIDFFLIYFCAPETFWDRTPIPNKKSQLETEAAREAYKELHKERDPHPFDDTASAQTPHLHRANSFAMRKPSFGGSIDSSHNEIMEAQGPVVALIQESGIRKTTTIDDESKLPQRKSYVQQLALLSGRHTKDKWWMVFLRPFVLIVYPPILFAAFMYAFAIVWLIMISLALSHIFTTAPYNYTPAVIGLFYVSPFVAGILGSSVAGKASDFFTSKMVKRNNGIYEPEFRLIMFIPVALSITIGLMGFGWSAQNTDLWIVPVVFFGIMSFGCLVSSTTTITYAIDCYKMFAAEALVTLNFTKNVIGFLFSLFNNSFIDNRGAKTAFLTYGGIQLFLCLMAIPLYFYGKRARSWTDRHEFMKFLYVHEDEEEEEAAVAAAESKEEGKLGLDTSANRTEDDSTSIDNDRDENKIVQ